MDAQGFAILGIAGDVDFKRSVTGLHERFEAAHRTLGEVTIASLSLQNLFGERFGAFSEPGGSSTRTA